MDIGSIISRCKNNDPKAQSILYNAYFPYVYTIVRRYMVRAEETEDVCLIVFDIIFRKLDDFDFLHEGGWKKWICRIAVRACLKRIKKRELFADLDEHDSIPDVDEEDSDLRQHQVLEKMPDGYRTVFNLHIVEGYTFQEISEILDISRNTAKSQWLKSKKYILTQLSKTKCI